MKTAREEVQQTYLKGQDEAGAKFAESKLSEFAEGQLVLEERMFETKGRREFEPRYEGPLLVLKRNGETVYLLEATKSGKKDEFHVDHMKPYYEPIRTYPLNARNDQEQESEEDEDFCSTNQGFVNFFYPLSESAVPPCSSQTAPVQRLDNGQDSSAVRRSTLRKTLRRLRSEYFWPRIKTEVQNYIRRCDNCQFSNQGASKAANALHFRPIQSFEHIVIDFIGPLETTPQGHNSILSIMDLFTKYPICGSNWDNILPMVAFAIRSTEHASTGYTPAKLLYGYELRQPQPFEELGGYPMINDSINHYATPYKQQIA
ncbi:K02A2.6-like [Cordylochernes scorpioides]|uniref:K02A2.6-like n=1 Tax=Cordylochernes scorpioides TaxID=51811 RepID=A0ABY6KMJ7_9ARAC|nr:K02A2.6-like [Cordylochernes scorpioides]